MPSDITAEERSTLLQSALDARALSYCPYSKFRVGAALLLEGGHIVQGANIENASYGAGICAERTALVKAATTPSVLPQGRAHGDGKSSPLAGRIRAIAVSSDLPASPCSPCGICRQFIREFAALSTPIFMVWKEWSGPGTEAPHAGPEAARGLGKGCHDEKGVVVKTLEELLPLSFGPEELDKI